MENLQPEPLDEFDSAMLDIVRCDDMFCPNLDQLYQRAIYVTAQRFDQPLLDGFHECVMTSTHDVERHQCRQQFLNIFSKYNEDMALRIDELRQMYSDDPLSGGNPLEYESPFWFEGAGDVWRRYDHRTPKSGVHNCQKVIQQAEQCLNDATKPNELCYRLYSHALICAPGMFCSSLRMPLLKCVQECHAIDYDRIKSCVRAIPNYIPCHTKYVMPIYEDPIDPDSFEASAVFFS